jgi:hypothetical protein
MFIGSQSDGPAKKTGVTFVQNVDDAVIVNVFSTFSDLVSTQRTNGDLFSHWLIAGGTKSHRLY